MDSCKYLKRAFRDTSLFNDSSLLCLIAEVLKYYLYIKLIQSFGDYDILNHTNFVRPLALTDDILN